MFSVCTAIPQSVEGRCKYPSVFSSSHFAGPIYVLACIMEILSPGMLKFDWSGGLLGQERRENKKCLILQQLNLFGPSKIISGGLDLRGFID